MPIYLPTRPHGRICEYLLLFLLECSPEFVISLLLAVALNQKIKGLAFFRTAYYIPVVAASVAVSAIWVWLLSDFGIINTFLKHWA